MHHSGVAEDIRQVFAVTNLEVAAIRAGDIAQHLAVLTKDAIYMPPNLLQKEGEELHAWLKDFVERFEVEWQSFKHGKTEVAGNLAYHQYGYSWRVTPKSGGEATVGHGKGLHVLRRQTDGSWKIAVNIWNSVPTPPGHLPG